MNKVILIGNLGADPVMRNTQNSQVTNFRMATSEKWKDKQTGEKKEKTEWHSIVVWGPQAQSCAQYLKTGSKVAVIGKLQTRKWTDNSNIERYTTEVVSESVEFLSTQQQQGQGGQGQFPPPPQPGGFGGQQNYPPQNNYPPPGDYPPGMDDDIPF